MIAAVSCYSGLIIAIAIVLPLLADVVGEAPTAIAIPENEGRKADYPYFRRLNYSKCKATNRK
jgi:hypothetical protein